MFYIGVVNVATGGFEAIRRDPDEYEPSRRQLLVMALSGVIALFALSRLKAVLCPHSLSDSHASQTITVR